MADDGLKHGAGLFALRTYKRQTQPRRTDGDASVSAGAQRGWRRVWHLNNSVAQWALAASMALARRADAALGCRLWLTRGALTGSLTGILMGYLTWARTSPIALTGYSRSADLEVVRTAVKKQAAWVSLATKQLPDCWVTPWEQNILYHYDLLFSWHMGISQPRLRQTARSLKALGWLNSSISRCCMERTSATAATVELIQLIATAERNLKNGTDHVNRGWATDQRSN